MKPAAPPPLQRPLGWVLLVSVVLVHLLWLDRLAQDRLGWGSAERPPPRIEVAFVRELMPAAAPEAAPEQAPRSSRAARVLPAVRAETGAPPASQAAAATADAPAAASAADAQSAAAPQGAASAAWPAGADPVLPAGVAAAIESTASTPGLNAQTWAPPPLDAAMAPSRLLESTRSAGSTPGLAGAAPPVAAPPASVAASTPRARATAATALAAAVAAASAVAAAAAPTPAFEWPASTRLTYRLEGNYRGPLQGSARVDWLRVGTRYQVHLETSLALVLSRRITSEGELTANGLAPHRFDGEQHVLFRTARRWSQRFGAGRITLADGREVDALPGVQDEASQFVQLTWLFTTQPQLLQAGRAIELPLVLNSRQDLWVYDVREQQTLRLPFGEVPTFHVTPRREARGGIMTAEIWFAPTLQYLPVRILIRQDESTYVDLMLDRPPLQAER